MNDWGAFMAKVPHPKKGCFNAVYPNSNWQQVPCKAAPAVPYPPARGERSATVGNGSDFSAQVTPRLISTAVGLFSSVTGVKSETGTSGGANAFSLQLNTNFFTTSTCSGAAVPADCQGWQQFVYSNVEGPHSLFMQYWLLDYATTCPGGWSSYGSDCYTNSNATDVPAQTIKHLAQMTMTGQVVSGGLDKAMLAVGGHIYSTSNEDSVVHVAQGWHVAEFNVFGDCCSSQANFNSGSTIVVRTTVNDGVTTVPSCVDNGFTGETNNLTVVETKTKPGKGFLPAIAFTQSNASGLKNKGKDCHPIEGK